MNAKLFSLDLILKFVFLFSVVRQSFFPIIGIIESIKASISCKLIDGIVCFFLFLFSLLSCKSW